MRWPSAFLAGAVALIGLPGVCAGQSAREVQVQGLGTFAERAFLGAGVGAALRSAGRARIALTLHAGDLDGTFAGRSELVASYHLNPYQQRGVSPYAGGGVTVGVAGGDVFEYVVLLLGVETTPGRRTSWYAELGLAGGVRVAAGFRVRWR